jgi:hypothetical protein
MSCDCNSDARSSNFNTSPERSWDAQRNFNVSLVSGCASAPLDQEHELVYKGVRLQQPRFARTAPSLRKDRHDVNHFAAFVPSLDIESNMHAKPHLRQMTDSVVHSTLRPTIGFFCQTARPSTFMWLDTR